jgi:pimeloyl-ACP methyl ester carboxylesterase
MSADPVDRWLFIRGLGRESAHWEEFPKAFEESSPGAAVCLLDLPGTGRYWQQQSPWSLGAITDALRLDAGLAKQEGNKGDGGACFAVAMSLGAMVVVDWMNRFPNELAGAVLINTSVRGLCPIWERLRPGAWPMLLKIAFTSSHRLREALILKLTTNLSRVDEGILNRREAVQISHPFSRSNLVRQLLAASHFSAAEFKSLAPILLLSSAGDRLVNPNCSRRLQCVWQATLATHPTANHDLPFDDPEWTIRSIRAWRSTIGK